MSDDGFKRTTRLRELVFDEMAPALQKAAVAIGAKKKTLARGSLLIIYDIGCLIRRICENERKYGRDAIVSLAAFFAMDLEDLKNVVAFARSFSREFVTREVARSMANGQFLTYHHFLVAMRGTSTRDQEQLLEHARRECLSPDELLRAINERKRQRSRR